MFRTPRYWIAQMPPGQLWHVWDRHHPGQPPAPVDAFHDHEAAYQRCGILNRYHDRRRRNRWDDRLRRIGIGLTYAALALTVTVLLIQIGLALEFRRLSTCGWISIAAYGFAILMACGMASTMLAMLDHPIYHARKRITRR